MDMDACLRANKVEIFLLCKYVDDINLETTIIPLGYVWKEISEEGRKVRKLVFTEEVLQLEQEKEQQESPEKRTIRLITEEASKQIKGIRFTYDTPEKHEDKKCPAAEMDCFACKKRGHIKTFLNLKPRERKRRWTELKLRPTQTKTQTETQLVETRTGFTGWRMVRRKSRSV